MKACKLCGAEYTERINFCFNDGEVLAAVGAGATGVLSDPFEVPSPGAAAPAMPPTHVARTPVPSERRQRSLVNQDNAGEGLLAQRPPAKPEPDDFTPRPLQTLDVNPSGDGPSEPMYSPPAGMDLDEVPASSTPVPLAPAPEPVVSAPPPTPHQTRATPEPDPSQDANARSSAMLLMVAVGAVVAALLLLLAVVMGLQLTGGEDAATTAGLADAIPEAVEPVPVAPPEPVEDPDPMDIPTPDPLDLGLPPEPVPSAPEPVAVVPEPGEDGGTDPATDPATDPEPGGEVELEDPTADPDGVAEVVAPSPEPTAENPWGTTAPTPEPQPETAKEGRVAFSSSPSGAELIINGEYRGSTPLTQVLAYGDYEVTMRLAGHVSQRKTLSVDASSAAVDSTLPKIEMAKAVFSAPGRDGDTLFVDGRPLGTLPREVELKPGSHIFTVEGPGGPRLTVTREVTMDDTKVVLQ